MARKSLERSDFYPYHVYNRTLEKDFYPINNFAIWNKCSDLLSKLKTEYGAQIHCFVLMSNHYHLLVSTPRENLDKVMWYYQSCFANWMCHLTNRKIYSFQSRYKWSVIKCFNHYQSVYKYVVRNPVRAGICKNVEQYPFSSIGDLNLSSIIQSHEFLRPWDPASSLDWLNKDTQNSVDLEKLRRGLKKHIFTPPERVRD